jgi:hypothetical protein
MAHESLDRTERHAASSNRSFGLIFAVVLAVIGLWPVLSGHTPRVGALVLGAAFLVAALLFPSLLGPLNQLWTKFGLLLHRVVSPVVLGIMFFIVITPIGLLMRSLGKNPLRLRVDDSAGSYWIHRRPPGPAPETLKDQFTRASRSTLESTR